MLRRHGGQYGAFGFVSVALTIKLLLKKGLFFAHDVVTHQFLKAPLELLLVELPFSLFDIVGSLVVALTGIAVPNAAAGLVVCYPLLVALVVAIVEHPSPRIVASYWLGASVVTATAVVASLGMLPDPAGIGSGVTYHLIHHTVAELLRTAVFVLGDGIAAAGAAVGVEVEETVGLLVSITAFAVVYGVLWERHVGHE
ncbi:hypothetical protein [Halobellus litoreus]|uniref:Uncharacterized protein n=1 Tax=Halobellus litoreus TaxID=755310 RepID=A0ABD6DRQ3_9EURY|nr:hypothetical protein [Halobellus litoreus]